MLTKRNSCTGDADWRMIWLKKADDCVSLPTEARLFQWLTGLLEEEGVSLFLRASVSGSTHRHVPARVQPSVTSDGAAADNRSLGEGDNELKGESLSTEVTECARGESVQVSGV